VSRRASRYAGLLAICLLVYLATLPIELAAVRFSRSDLFGIDRGHIAESLAPHARQNRYPDKLQLVNEKRAYSVGVQYTFNEQLQRELTQLYQRYRPDYAAFVAIDADMGAVLAMLSYTKDGRDLGNMTLRATYPAASVFKLVTAAAALDRGVVQPTSVVPYNGRRSTLYKRQVLRHRNQKWTRTPTVQRAFAESINTVFARIGVFQLGANTLTHYAERFGFNQTLQTDLRCETSLAKIGEDQWAVAEAASGFTQTNTLSPLHGAMLASVAINEGQLVAPYVVNMVTDEHGVPLYTAEPRYAQVIGRDAARKLQQLMQETVRRGSARNAFRKFYRGKLKNIQVGGKTGSLTGHAPKGKHDWFIGYAQLGDRKLAFASLTINKKYWTVKSSYVARKLIEAYFNL